MLIGIFVLLLSSLSQFLGWQTGSLGAVAVAQAALQVFTYFASAPQTFCIAGRRATVYCEDAMATPVKSPAQKRIKADEGAIDEDFVPTGEECGAAE